MKVLFLDIDGVCNSAKYAEAEFKKTGVGGLLGIDQSAAKLVRKIVAETDCKVVLSSHWRHSKKDRDIVAKEVTEYMDCTEDLAGAMRGDEVNHWLIRWAKEHNVERYAILDDDSDFHPDQPLFKTTFAKGLTNKIANDVIQYLNTGVRRADS